MRLEIALRKSMGPFSLDVSIEASGDVLTLFGPSGAGKSLTIQCLAGLLRPDAGRIVLDGDVIFDSVQGIDSAPQARRLGYVPQSYALFPHLTVAQNLAFGLRQGDGPQSRMAVGAMLERMRLTALAGLYPAQVSGGQKQRVALARALMVRPRLLLLDEPFAALDAPLRTGLRENLIEARSDLGVGIVLVTHDMADVHVLADTVAVMSQGRVLQVGPRETVFRRPVSADVARMTGAGNILAGTVVGTAGDRCTVSLGACSIETEKPRDCNTHVTVVIRPELVRLLTDGESTAQGETVLPARVRSATERGHHTWVELTLTGADGVRLEVIVPVWWWNRHALPPGSDARVAIPRDAVHVLAAPAPAGPGHSGHGVG